VGNGGGEGCGTVVKGKEKERLVLRGGRGGGGTKKVGVEKIGGTWGGVCEGWGLGGVVEEGMRGG